MADIKVFCPQCGQHIQCDESYRGMQISCPTCQQLFLIPQVQQSIPTATAQAEQPAIRNPSPQPLPSLQPIQLTARPQAARPTVIPQAVPIVTARRKPSIFKKIECREDALHIVNRAAGLLTINASVCVIMLLNGFYINKQAGFNAAFWIGGLTVASICAFFLWKIKSRTAAIFCLVATCLSVTTYNLYFSWLFLLFLLLYIRTVEATFKLHGSLRE